METKIATSVNQSKTLIELGIDVNTADMYYYNNDEIPQIISDIKLLKKNINPKFYTLAWSLSALMELMPLPLLTQHINNKWYMVTYPNGKRISLDEYDNPIDAAYEMICYLFENKLI